MIAQLHRQIVFAAEDTHYRELVQVVDSGNGQMRTADGGGGDDGRLEAALSCRRCAGSNPTLARSVVDEGGTVRSTRGTLLLGCNVQALDGGSMYPQRSGTSECMAGPGPI